MTITNENHYATRSKPLFTRAQHVLDQTDIFILVNEAKKKAIGKSVQHGADNSKCFCFNASVKWDKEQKPEILQIESLISKSSWDALSNLVQEAALNLIRITGEQATVLGASLADKTTWIAFELIRVRLKGGTDVPELPWHRDPGYLDIADTNPSHYAEYTTVFMLTDPNSEQGWNGGILELQKNGIEREESPPVNKSVTEAIQYCYNEAVTFYNRDSRHRVTQITAQKNSEDRIVFIASIYGEKETKDYLDHHTAHI